MRQAPSALRTFLPVTAPEPNSLVGDAVTALTKAGMSAVYIAEFLVEVAKRVSKEAEPVKRMLYENPASMFNNINGAKLVSEAVLAAAAQARSQP